MSIKRGWPYDGHQDPCLGDCRGGCDRNGRAILADKIKRVEDEARYCDCKTEACERVRSYYHMVRADSGHLEEMLWRIIGSARTWIRLQGHGSCARDDDWHTGEECDLPGAKHPRSRCTCGYADMLKLLMRPGYPDTSDIPELTKVEMARAKPFAKRRELNPDEGHGAGDGFGGTDYPDVQL